MKVILACLLFVGLSLADYTCNCGWRNAGRIIGGRESRKNEYPWIVSVQFTANKTHNCGGTIITPWHVLSAAHCYKDTRPEDFEVVVGRHDTRMAWEDTNNVHPIASYHMHPGYNRGMLHDIGILVTATEIRYNRFVGPACIPPQNLGYMLGGQYVKAIGWGQTQKDEYNAKKALREVDLQIMDYNVCKNSVPAAAFSGKQMCTYAPSLNTGGGDSGGPMVWLDPTTNRYNVLAVASHAYYGPDNKPSVLTDVSAYADWIENIVRSTKNLYTCHKV